MPSQVTTHILDTSRGLPAEGVTIELHGPSDKDGDWSVLASGKTNADGRVSDLLADGETLKPGVYRMVFKTGAYYKALDTRTFYPEVQIAFEVSVFCVFFSFLGQCFKEIASARNAMKL